MPHNKKAIFQDSLVSADVLLQEKTYEIPEDKTLSLSVRLFSIFLLIVFIGILVSGIYTNWPNWFY